MQVNMKGSGTNAGWKTVNESHKPWVCPKCQVTQPGYRSQCAIDGTIRP